MRLIPVVVCLVLAFRSSLGDYHIDMSNGNVRPSCQTKYVVGQVAADSYLSEGTICPWVWEDNVDDNRHPHVIREAKCRSPYARTPYAQLNMIHCQQLTIRLDVLMVNEHENKRSNVTREVSVGCVAVMNPQHIINDHLSITDERTNSFKEIRHDHGVFRRFRRAKAL